MNINTERLNPLTINGKTPKELLNVSQEYYALAVLRYLYCSKYQNHYLSDAPDLQGENCSVEVTIAEDSNDMRANREFEYYKDGNEKSLKKIQECGSDVNTLFSVKTLVKSGGRTEKEKELLRNAFIRKIEKGKSYLKKNNHLELVILRTEIASSLFRNNLCDWVKEIINDIDNQIYEVIYIMFSEYCFVFDSHGNVIEKHDLSPSVSNRLHVLARKTAENEISLNDEEWL